MQIPSNGSARSVGPKSLKTMAALGTWTLSTRLTEQFVGNVRISGRSLARKVPTVGFAIDLDVLVGVVSIAL